MKQVNLLTMVHIPGEPDSSLGDVLKKQLELREEEIVKGATVAFPNVVLKVASLREDGTIDTVEVLPSRSF